MATRYCRQLRAYDINPVSIDQNDLPLDAEVDKLKIEVVPYYRSGLLLDFPVRRSHGATLHLTLDDGAPMPSGAIVRIAGRDEEFPVALQGEAYLTGLDQHNRLRATWKGKSCEFDADLPRTADPLPDLGTFRLPRSDAMTRPVHSAIRGRRIPRLCLAVAALIMAATAHAVTCGVSTGGLPFSAIACTRRLPIRGTQR